MIYVEYNIIYNRATSIRSCLCIAKRTVTVIENGENGSVYMGYFWRFLKYTKACVFMVIVIW